MILSFDEIADWQVFEDLAAAYFEMVQKDSNNDITEVRVEPSGEGPDGGRDILVTFRVSDSVQIFERKWVIQCKFYTNSVSKTHLCTVNIPSLIHEYSAHGYLLICKNGVTSNVSNMFENLRRNCKFGYSYEIWTGPSFLRKIRTEVDFLAEFFPLYHQYYISKYGL